MEFGYFTLSDNHYPDNPRSANQLVLEIREQAILADKIGMHSAWIGEHHFDSLGVNSRPDLVLANVAAQTRNIRLAPAVSVLPLHHPSTSRRCGRRSTCSPAAGSTSLPAAATTARSTRRSAPTSWLPPRCSRKESTCCSRPGILPGSGHTAAASGTSRK